MKFQVIIIHAGGDWERRTVDIDVTKEGDTVLAVLQPGDKLESICPVATPEESLKFVFTVNIAKFNE